MKQKSKCERPNETRGKKPTTKLNPKGQEKSPVSVNIPKPLRRFYIVTLKHQDMHHIIAFKVSICMMGWAFTKPSTVGPCFVPHHS